LGDLARASREVLAQLAGDTSDLEVLAFLPGVPFDLVALIGEFLGQR
jgi:hypothetical protein